MQRHAVLGHELRGPLAAIRNAAELIRTYLPNDSKVLPSVAVVERQTRRMNRLMDDLLDVARIAQGKVQFRPTTINVVDVVRAAVEGIRPLAGGLEMKAVLPDRPVLVRADPDQLDQILLNLLTNAVKFTTSGSVQVAVEAAYGEGVLRIRDTGIGIAPEALPQIFSLFVQSNHSTD
jgi:signal transduction histidine kinase